MPSVKAEEAPSSAPKASACTAARHRSVPAICANATYPRTEVGRMRRWEAGGAAQRCVRRKHCCVSACCLGPIFVRRFDRQVICKPHEESQNIYCRVACVSRQGHGNLQFATRVSPRAPFPSLSVVGVRARGCGRRPPQRAGVVGRNYPLVVVELVVVGWYPHTPRSMIL